MKKKILYLILTLFLVSSVVNGQLKMYNYGTPNLYDVASDIIVLPDSSKIIIGFQYTSQTTAGFDNSQQIIFRVDKNENFVWAKKLNSSSLKSTFYGKLASDGNLFIYGGINYTSNNYGSGKGFFGKMNIADGSMIWQNEILSNSPTPFAYVNTCLELPSGNIIIAGSVDRASNSICFRDSYIAKIDASGNVITSHVKDMAPNGSGCKNDYYSQLVMHNLDTIIARGSKRGPSTNGKDNRNNNFFAYIDTNLNILLNREIDIRFIENSVESENDGFEIVDIINNKMILRNAINGPNWGTTRNRYGFSKVPVANPNVIENPTIIKTNNNTHSSFGSMIAIGEDDYFFSQASTPAKYGWTTAYGAVGGSENSFITRIKNGAVVYTKTIDDIGFKGFNRISFINNYIYGIGFSEGGNNQVGPNQDIFIAQTDTNFSSFEICSYQDSNEVYLDVPSGAYINSYSYTNMPEVISSTSITLNFTDIPFSNVFTPDTLSILNECQCIFRDTITASCLPYISPLGDTFTSPGFYTIDSVFYPFNCDTVYYANLTGSDLTPPSAVCQNTTIYLNGSGNATIDSSHIDNGSTDNCAIVSMTLSNSSFNCSNTGPNNVTLTVYDANGNSDNCNATVTVVDTVRPNPSCQNITVYLNAGGNASITPAQIDNGSTDNCAIASMTVSPNSFTCANVGANAVTLVVTDVNGNIDSCSATVTVQDTVRPNPSCQNITVQLDASGNASITPAQIDNGSTDNCAIASRTVSPNSFTCANVGANAVTLVVTDVNGNIDSCSATVTVQDTVRPNPSCQNITVYLNAGGNASITPAQIDNGSTDNCAIASMIVSPNTFTCADLGANAVTLVVTDVNSNIDSCLATVTVVDTFSSVATCKDTTVYLNAGGNVTIDSSFVLTGAGGGCASVTTASISQSAFTCANVGINVVNVLINGVTNCNANVTVLDTIRPTVLCQNITVQLDASGNASITPAQIDNGSTDNCAIASMTVSPNSFTCANVGANAVTLVVTDVNGNSDSCSATVTVQDMVNPTVVCQNITVQLDASGNASITPAQIDNGSTDNCAIASMTVSPNSFTCANVGANAVTLVVTDVNGNSDSCSATVTVQDTVNPTVVCQNITVQLDASGNASITPAQIDNGSTDNCAIATRTVSPNSFTCANVGANSVTLVVTDVNGNSDSCSATVTVRDTVSPVVQLNNIVVYLDSNGTVGIIPSQIDNGSSDNCAIASMAVVPNTFDCNDVGLNNVTLTVTDVNGNYAAAVASIDVRDDISPWFLSCPAAISDTLRGLCDYVVPNFMDTLTFYDNCNTASAIITQSPLPGTILQANTNGTIANYTINIDVTDGNANLSTCIHQVSLVCYPELEIPEFISPNNDGQNDVWFIKGIEAFGDHNIKVFNRLGNLVFESNDYQNDWNANSQQGINFNSTPSGTLPSGTYYYIIKTNLNEEKVYKGFLFIRP